MLLFAAGSPCKNYPSNGSRKGRPEDAEIPCHLHFSAFFAPVRLLDFFAFQFVAVREIGVSALSRRPSASTHTHSKSESATAGNKNQFSIVGPGVSCADEFITV